MIVKKSSDSNSILAKGSLLWASKPAEIKITSGLNLSTGSSIFWLNISINSLPTVPAFKVALKIFPFPVSFSDPVPGNNGNSWDDPYATDWSL